MDDACNVRSIAPVELWPFVVVPIDSETVDVPAAKNKCDKMQNAKNVE